jgi:Domain of unknown function (DUF4349)
MKNRILITLLCGAVMAASCKNKGDYKALNASSSDSALVAADSVSPQQAKLVKTADMRFKVKNVEQTSENITSLTTKYNGMVMHHDMTASDEQTSDTRLNNDSVMRVLRFNTNADMTMKIPSEKIEEFLDAVSHMSIYVNVRRMDIEDKSLDYLSSQMKLNSRKELVSQQKAGRLVFKNPDAVLDLKDGLVDEQINNRKIDDEVKYSVISLDFYQSNTISKEIIVNDDPESYKLPFSNRLLIAFGDGWSLFKELVILLADMWVFIVGAIGVWVAVRWYKGKNTRLNLPL